MQKSLDGTHMSHKCFISLVICPFMRVMGIIHDEINHSSPLLVDESSHATIVKHFLFSYVMVHSGSCSYMPSMINEMVDGE